MKSLLTKLLVFCVIGASVVEARPPRIVNIYNFIRNSDYRLPNSEEVLYEASRHEIELIKPTGLTNFFVFFIVLCFEPY